jgi:hypothetical protein
MISEHRKYCSPQRLAFSLIGLLLIPPAVFAQVSGDNELSQYTSAVARVDRGDRVVQLEHFAIHAQSGPLRTAALQFVIAEYLRDHNISHALSWAHVLEETDKNNAIALALLSDEAKDALQRGAIKPAQVLAMASRGLDNLMQVMRPPGMSAGDFADLQRRADAMLSAAAGTAEVQMRDFVAARAYLHNAVATEPNNAGDVYELALADLNGKDRDRKEGYWCLARAVNLARGTPPGIEIARFARAQYVKDGGSTSDWNDYLSATASPNAKAPPAIRTASISPPPSVPQPLPKTTPPATVAVARPPAVSKPSVAQPAASVWADDSAPAVVRKRRIPSTLGPMSLGILMETSLANKGSRSAVVNTLIDMLRHMSDQDEAFILTYDNNLVFAQDLTSDPKQLEEALEGIKPERGAVLDDAIAFAAGHLARIAKYPNRVLLVVSDGRNIDSHESPTQTSAEINAAGVRIFCIGVDVSEGYGRARLQALSSSTGGQSSFISDPGQFRRATKEMAQNMGIDFKF